MHLKIFQIIYRFRVNFTNQHGLIYFLPIRPEISKITQYHQGTKHTDRPTRYCTTGSLIISVILKLKIMFCMEMLFDNKIVKIGLYTGILLHYLDSYRCNACFVFECCSFLHCAFVHSQFYCSMLSFMCCFTGMLYIPL